MNRTQRRTNKPNAQLNTPRNNGNKPLKPLNKPPEGTVYPSGLAGRAVLGQLSVSDFRQASLSNLADPGRLHEPLRYRTCIATKHTICLLFGGVLIYQLRRASIAQICARTRRFYQASETCRHGSRASQTLELAARF